MYYDKRLRYLDYLENGERIRNVGFVKIEVMDQLCNIQVQVTGLHSSDNSTREVRLQGNREGMLKEASLGMIALQAGRGSLMRRRIPTASLCDGIGYDDLIVVKINLGKSRELVCRWKEEKGQETIAGQPASALESTVHSWREQMKQEQIPKEQIRQAQGMSVQRERIQQEQEQQERVQQEQVRREQIQQEQVRQEQNRQEQIQQEQEQQEQIRQRQVRKEQMQPEAFREEMLQEKALQAKLSRNEEEQLHTQSYEEEAVREELYEEREFKERESEKWETEEQERQNLPPQRSGPVVPVSLSEDKWKQLSSIYPHIAPFHDERDYLSIGPGDFVILPKKYYRLVTNSFLLHGFYNYGHMVLARSVKKGEEQFYLGVPGNFYERERQVAIMFGFESFECKKEPVQMGDYGYFMIRVEL